MHCFHERDENNAFVLADQRRFNLCVQIEFVSAAALTLFIGGDLSGLSPGAVRAAAEEAVLIWKGGGIELTTVDRIQARQRRPDVYVYFTRKLRPSDHLTPHRARLAWIPFAGGYPTNRIFVSTAAAERLLHTDSRFGPVFSALPPAGQERTLARVLGRALAHEIGHYLLASPEHTRTGLMRATQSIESLARDDLTAFTLP